MLWVDDSKPEPNGCSVARTYDDALRMLRRYEWDVLYLDHDLGDDDGRTGYDLLVQIRAENRVPREVVCISWNPVGKRRIVNLVSDIEEERATPTPEADRAE
jgi:DNA-binding response OmpR family regulator